MFGKPEQLSLDAVGASFIELSWLAPVGGNAQSVAEYVVTWVLKNINDTTNETTTSVENVAIQDLTSNAKYAFFVAARAAVDGPNGDVSDGLEAITRK